MRRRRARRPSSLLSFLGIGFAVLLISLSVVTWRQSRAFEVLAGLDEVRRALSVAAAAQGDLARRIQHLESRMRISTVAAQRFGMHQPDASEIVLWAREAP